jgi:hypothetical protein
MSEDEGPRKRPSCGCMLLAVLPLAILLIFFIVVVLRTVARAL